MSQPSFGIQDVPANNGNAELNLIFFDEADIILEDDYGLYAEIKSLAKSSKCPVILTSQVVLQTTLVLKINRDAS